MARLGIMQGRLSPPVNNNIQAFPVNHWRDEFSVCRHLGLACMEWIFEHPTLKDNPLCSDSGIQEIRSLSGSTGVAVSSVVADYFMARRLFGPDRAEVAEAVKMLYFLIEQCRICRIPIIEIPFVDASALQTDADISDMICNTREPFKRAASYGIHIGLETSLAPQPLKALLDAFRPLAVQINYDMGNSASLGYDPAEEIGMLGEHIINVHIKDRVTGGGTVPLGRGSVDFAAVFSTLAGAGYSGDCILQAARQDLADTETKKGYRETVQEYMGFITPFMKELS